jgi:multimeric flavodoxin WrbA
MKITILNGNPADGDRKFDQYLADLTITLHANKQQVQTLLLRDLNLAYCTGCFGCWVKTPGECITKDDGPSICRAIIQSDFTLWASPLKMGYPSVLLKKAMDKMIPLIHPYFAVDQGESHHRARYSHYPRLGLLVSAEEDTDAEDIRIVTDLFSRTALNMKSRLEFCAQTTQNVVDVAEAILKKTGSKHLYQANLPATKGVTITPPKRLTVFNGSPRGVHSNTNILLDHFLKGFQSISGRETTIVNLIRPQELKQSLEAYQQAECVILGFPLYTDAMPAIDKTFIEMLADCRNGNNPPMGFLVQSGFSEARHSRHVERYLQKLTARLNSPYLGSIIKGGIEGIQIRPESMTRKLFESYFQIGESFAESGQFDPNLLKKLARPESYPAYLGPLFSLFTKLPKSSWYWDHQMKENGVFEKRFNRPYEEEFNTQERSEKENIGLIN